MTSGALTSGLAALVAGDGPGSAHISELYVLAACTGQSRQAVTSEMYTLAATLGTDQNWPRMTASFTLVAYGTGVPDLRRGRAWTYNFDGHSFYVLDLGDEGTWVYDFVSGQWSRFETQGYAGVWNARLGTYWAAKRKTVVSDVVNGYLHFIDPEETLDEGWRPISYTVTAGVEARNRNFHTQESFRLIASLGDIGDPLGATITFRFSDDFGETWRATYTTSVEPGVFQEIAWRSLGTIRAPGRIFEVSSDGGLIRIDAADAEIDGMDDGGQG